MKKLTKYKRLENDVWQGRIDDPENFDAFRWHQWVKTIDLLDKNLQPISKEVNGFCFLGFCCDEGVELNEGRPGAAKGPISIRKEMAKLPCRFDKETKLFDGGNIISLGDDLETVQNELAIAVEKILSLNLFPIILGGGHEIAFGHYNGILSSVLKEYKDPKIGIINFDAHFDLRPYPNGGNSGTMFRQIADKCKEIEIDYSYFGVGIQKYGNTVSLFKKADELGAEYILAKDINNSNILNVLNQLDDYIKSNEYIYITICSDVFSSAFAPGVSSSQPLGLTPKIVLELLKYIIKSDKVLSFDIAEVSPRFDQDNSTANLAAIIIFAVINTLIGEE
ncbi:formimidoylglutamase [Selenihalanaerobacter shriftii]|uniref:Formimidoylglutamase n=1 Tax=Selenihalanaerobacter shriftii TaxID=142842 RepID=A0A1T4MPQ4_9FIRM|nr:formimidoylglutamase [Selenihalanaerobacter shriftii]SJZ68841.1 formiminoglutamase [Selenihalanaerobacter shriftii]